MGSSTEMAAIVMATLVALAAAHALPATSAGATSATGVTLKIYKNLGLFGAPASTSVLTTPEFEHSASEPFSAEMVGTLDFPAGGGVFRFDCNWTVATMGYVWVDGHMVCQDAHTYKPGAGTTDNPLPVNTFKRSKGIVASLPFRAHYYFNGKSPPAPPPPTTCTGVSSVGIFDDHGGGMHHKCGFKQVGGYNFHNTREIAAKTCFEAGYKVAGSTASKGQEIWCGNTATPSCPKLSNAKGVPCPGNKSETCGDAWKLEVFTWTECHAATPAPGGGGGAKAGLSIAWAKGATRDEANKAIANPIPSAVLTPTLPAEEAQRDELQRSMTTGWGAWMHSNMLAMVKLPDNAVVTPQVCLAGSTTCISSAVPDGAKPRPGNRPGVSTRVGLHAYDRSYVQFFVGPSPSVGANISVEYSASGDTNGDIVALFTPVSCPQSKCEGVELVLDGRYAWLSVGGLNSTASALAFTPPGCAPFSLYTTAGGTPVAPTPSGGASLAINLGKGAVGFSTSPNPSVSSIQVALKAARAKEEALLQSTFGATRAGEGFAVKASAMWNLISTPAENGGAPFLPVSRVWSFTPGPINSDFTYAIFDWDNLFATLLVASGASNSTTERPAGMATASEEPTFSGFKLAVSNLFQVIKSKTAAGFVPNFAAGGLRSQDRTEPPIGAKVTLDLVKKFGVERMKWVVKVVFNDLLDWNDWFIRKRLKPPLMMVALGTFNDQTGKAGNMQDARFESGLDNSPMYDGNFVNTTDGCSQYESGCGLMQLYDVGMTSMFVQEAFALAELAQLIGEPQALTDMLTKRGTDMAQLISEHLWHEDLGIFVNRFSADHANGSFYPHVSPTSFYALQAKAATDAQATRMAESWLTNKSRFCVAPNGDYQGNDDTCYWGLPSIEASDPAYPALGYWRGYIWGPQAQLTYWSLQNYDHVPAVRAARKAMCKQLAGLMMSQWDQHRHICENYNPHKDAMSNNDEGDCSGTRFYHWGALTGMIGLMEDGLF